VVFGLKAHFDPTKIAAEEGNQQDEINKHPGITVLFFKISI